MILFAANGKVISFYWGCNVLFFIGYTFCYTKISYSLASKQIPTVFTTSLCFFRFMYFSIKMKNLNKFIIIYCWIMELTLTEKFYYN